MSDGADRLARERIGFIAILAAAAFGFSQQALKLQRTETERRLGDLNNEGARLAAAVAANVSSDTWEGFWIAYKDDQQRVAERMSRIQSTQAKMLGGLILASVAVPMVVAVVTYVLTRHAVPIMK